MFTKAQSLSGVLLVLLTLGGGLARAEDVVTLEELVKQWVELRSEIADAERTWTEQEKTWNQEIALLKEEWARLQQALDADAKKRVAELTDRTELVARKNELKSVLEELRAILGDTANHTEAVSRQMQQRLASYSEQDDLHHSIQVSRQIVEVSPGTRKEVDVLRLGLARAFAVSDANDWAAVGTVHGDSWQWAARPELANTVRRSIAIYAHDEAAALVKLPLQAIEVGE